MNRRLTLSVPCAVATVALLGAAPARAADQPIHAIEIIAPIGAGNATSSACW